MMKFATISAIFGLSQGALKTKCEWEYIETLEGWYKHAKICCPETDKDENDDFKTLYPITIYQHGDLGGGPSMFAYARMFSHLAAEGVCVVAPSSCPADVFCENGEISYAEVLKSLVYVD